MEIRPEFTVIAGANGAGKSRLTEENKKKQLRLTYSKYRFLYQIYMPKNKVTAMKGRVTKQAVMKSVWKTYRQIAPGSQTDSMPK